MPSTPSLKDIMLATQAAVQSIDAKIDTVIANQGADSANIAAIAAAQVIHEQLLRADLDRSSIDYSGKFGADAENAAIDTAVAAIPTQVVP